MQHKCLFHILCRGAEIVTSTPARWKGLYSTYKSHSHMAFSRVNIAHDIARLYVRVCLKQDTYNSLSITHQRMPQYIMY